VIRATGMVKESFRKNLEAIPGKHSTDSLQQTAVLGTAHIIRKVLRCGTGVWVVGGAGAPGVTGSAGKETCDKRQLQ
jgi:hypothetical protein